MKLQLIEKISRQAVALVLLAGICLLYSKGIVPVYTTVLFLFSGTIIGFFFQDTLLCHKNNSCPASGRHIRITFNPLKT